MQIHPYTAVLDNRRIILYDAALFFEPPAHLFEAEYILDKGLLQGRAAGRGEVWFFQSQGMDLVWRHFYRGGIISKLLQDQYLRLGIQKSRSWREWRFLSQLYNLGLPVPRPVAAQVQMGTIFYYADLITERIPGACSLAESLKSGSLSREEWNRIGATIALFHRHGVCHSDLNAYNIVFDFNKRIFILDFDQARVLRSKFKQRQNLARLLRSLRKIKSKHADFAFHPALWPLLLQGYYERSADVESSEQ